MASNDITFQVIDWSDGKEDLTNIRHLVFINEQKVPEKLEWDGFDNVSTHFLAIKNNQAIACARLKPDGQIGRMAVLQDYRNQGIGSKLLQLVLQHVDAENIKKTYLHAQLSAIAFYEKQAFVAFGDIFFEANIPHQAMFRKVC